MEYIFTLCIVGLVAYSMLKKFNPQATLITAGLLLLAYASISGIAPVLADGKTQGALFFDLWQRFTEITNTRLGSVGLTLVSIAGVSTYLNHIGASQALVKATSRPVMAVKNPYVLLILVLIFVSLMYVFITGATSLSLLLMGTLYPVLRNAGISAKTAVATIVIPTAWEYGPGQINAVIGANAINVEIMDFVVNHQTIFQAMLLILIPLVNIVWQRHCDRIDGYNPSEDRGKYLETLEKQHDDNDTVPKFYALLPILPFIFLFGFSSMVMKSITMTIPIAMMSTISICIIIEAIRFRSIQRAFDNFEAWLKGTGMIFASVLTLMIAAEYFSAGLTNIGAINTLIDTAKSFDLGPSGIVIVFSGFILLTAFITGSGNAPVMAFIPIVPQIATNFDVNPLLPLLPILFAAGIGRTMSPVAGVIITVSGMAGLTPIDVIKRTSVPMLSSMVVVLIMAVIQYS
ncbi:C4-dicarboxylate ABC transporter [Photobacterium carnosum]|jgi:DcuC family C4-dicarboxylate transporter|uniref:C4-dicarboxylate transporter DcuC n=1 Tax=Photobacterium TaxID=657 RepID=UPI000D171AC5|nr:MULTISPECIES: C4-dicarboxylate transporter DcuC [Photobacterium]KAE8177705.1 C4-dicarboxylate ABC transporter [Photobacterium carnosum]MCD9494371.1 C4-dicarboxylate ABC transporter [Photobacterium carnosum]MCD9497289.1 C4-dicarboxylate ABC transporter [Photobacterium carnosum]MCD9521697.1 C4-dicarboxylate ABC transporter [Photobacterium carnosum]MCD9527748.1 C4-dicarboxylate ABC transporter [Photobacterium carnosum]